VTTVAVNGPDAADKLMLRFAAGRADVGLFGVGGGR
jgi:hypothetical protein